MNVLFRGLGLGLMVAGLSAGAVLSAAADGDGRTYAVSITNLHKFQVVTPPAVIAHKGGYALFQIGHAASDGLAELAETGSPAGVADEASLDLNVAAVATGGGPILPGHTQVIEIAVPEGAGLLSVAAMLAGTNDAFAAVRALRLPRGRRTAQARGTVYDAGSEANNEDCDFIPGPPCGNGNNERATEGAEGFVHVHNGVHGGAGLNPADSDWRNPGIDISVRRVRGGDDG